MDSHGGPAADKLQVDVFSFNDRVKAFADVDVTIGAAIPIGHSLLASKNGGTGIGPVVGIIASVGSTF